MTPLPRFVLGATAYNDHVQQMARALFEVDRLVCYMTGAVDVWHSRWSRGLREGAAQVPALDRQLARRAITHVPGDVVTPRWGWDLVRTVANVAGAGAGAQDWLWERGERSLDRATARLLERKDTGGYLGVEFGALASLQAARRLGKPGLVSFLSPHHRTRARWVDPELSRFGGIEKRAQQRLRTLAIDRDRLRDEEAATADGIVTGSSFTTRSLVAAGVPEARIVTVPLGGPEPMSRALLPPAPGAEPTFVFAGSVAVHKGVHHLADAWIRLAPSRARLHFYGRPGLPSEVLGSWASRSGGSIVFHGSVAPSSLPEIYRHASALVLPTLADGFGQVVADALASGLPVITTANAGAADRIVHGESGFVLPPADVDALASTLDWCLTHPAELHAMRVAALEAAGRWTWAHFRRAFIAGVSASLSPQQRAVARTA